jgi:hypothetical protein
MRFLTLVLFGAMCCVQTANAKITIPKIKASKSKATSICKKVGRPAKSKANTKVTNKVKRQICQYYAASAAERRKAFNAYLNIAVKMAMLTPKGKSILKKSLTKPNAVNAWNPTTSFGITLKQKINDSNSAHASTGAIVGGVIGGVVGGILSGGAGVALGITVGSAIGSLVETFVNLEGSPAPSGGTDSSGSTGGSN